MNRTKQFNTKTKIMMLVFLVSSFILVFVFKTSSLLQIDNLYAESRDGYIKLEWDNPLIMLNKKVHIDIYCNGILYDNVILNDSDNEYLFTNGNHGKKYDFFLYVEDEDGFSEKKKCQSMFINYDDMPNLPIVNIETEGRVLPSYEKAIKPDGTFGESITNNNYVRANMDMLSLEDNRHIYNDEINIRIRGNTSALGELTCYKILLGNKTDLFERNEDRFIDDEYLLINKGVNFNWAIGIFFSNYFGLEWQPEYQYVNLFINGDYRGCYLLIENVKNSDGRIQLSDDGVLFENNAYWWNSGGKYFRTDFQYEKMGYTIIYPKFENVIVNKLKTYLNEFESLLFSGDDRCLNYIDIDSFARWLLVNDIIGSRDSAGTNMYLVKNDDIFSDGGQKIKMVTNWDFDSFLMCDGWSDIHTNNILYYSQLFGYKEFNNKYISIWDKAYSSIYDDFCHFIDDMCVEKGKDILDSCLLTMERFDYGIIENNLSAYLDEIKHNIKDRIKWINENIYNRTKTIFTKINKESNTLVIMYTYDDTDQDFKVAVWNEENGQDDLIWYNMSYSDDMNVVEIDLNNHLGKGVLSIHVYSNGDEPIFMDGISIHIK